MDKVALIFPRFKYPSGDLPLGIAYIASTLLNKTNAKVKVIDTTFFDNFNEIEEIFKKEKFDFVGISLMTTMVSDARKIIKIIAKTNPNTKIIVGGPHATVLPKDALQIPHVDAIVIGEGEETMVEIVNKRTFNQIKGVWYKKDNEIIKNSPREPLKDLNEVPFPAWNLFPLKNYFYYWYQLDSVSGKLRGMNIMTSRGCPYQCSYCQPTLSKIFGKKLRRRSVENVISELKQLKQDYGINAFMIDDDTFNIDKLWVKKFCKTLIKEKLNLFWGCNTRANLVDKDLFSLMKKAGLKKVFMGIESGSQRILNEVYNKGITIKQVKNAVDILNSLNIRIQGFFMLGAPTETRKEMNKTIKFARRLKIDEATFSVTTPLPQTYLYNKTKESVNLPAEKFDYYKTYVFNDSHSQKMITYYKRKALLSFYLSGKRLKKTMEYFLSWRGIKKLLMKLKRF